MAIVLKNKLYIIKDKRKIKLKVQKKNFYLYKIKIKPGETYGE